MRDKFNFLIALFSLLYLVFLPACGFQVGQQKGAQNPNIQMFDFLTPREAKAQFDKWEVKCQDVNNCPDSVAQLLVIDGSSFGGCTATLIGEDQVLTNSHCLDFKDERTGIVIPPERLCENGTTIIFPNESPSGKEVARCKKILVKSALGKTRLYADYMVLQLDRKLNRAHDAVVRDGLSDGETLKIRKVSPMAKGYGELVVENCQVLYRTGFVPGAKTPDYYIHAITGCEVIKGNSGSSLVGEKGEIKAVVFAGVLQQDLRSMNDWQKSLIQKARQLKTSLVTNATCIIHEFPGAVDFDLEKCIKNSDETGKLEDLVDSSEFRRRINSQISMEKSRLPKTFGYKLHLSQGGQVAHFAPGCITKGGTRREEYARAPVILWQATYVASDKLRPLVELETYHYACDLRWSPDRLAQTGQTPISMIGSFCFDSSGNRGTQKSTWILCEP